jgi:hypothetical protein
MGSRPPVGRVERRVAAREGSQPVPGHGGGQQQSVLTATMHKQVAKEREKTASLAMKQKRLLATEEQAENARAIFESRRLHGLPPVVPGDLAMTDGDRHAITLRKERLRLRRLPSDSSDGPIDSLSELNDDDEDEPLWAMAHKEVAMAAKTIEAICEKPPLKVKICIHDNKEKAIKLTDAADLIVAHSDFNSSTWHEERAKTLKLSASAGRKASNGITDEAAVVGCLMAKLVCQGKSY